MFTHLLLLALLTGRWPTGPGTTAFPLLRVPLGPRACAMGEAFTGLADDVNAVFWNPAGLGQVAAPQFAVSHQEWFADIRDEHLGLVVPAGPGSLAGGVVYSTTGNIEVWNPETGDRTEAAAHSGYAAFGYGLMLGERLHVGLSAKGLYDNLLEQTGTGFCLDAGLLFRAARFRLGCAARNLGWGMRYGPDNVALPMALSIGASYDLRRLSLVADVNTSLDNLPDVHVGVEYPVYGILAVRTGCRLGPQDWRTLSWTSVFTAGLGINLGAFALDYAFVPYGRLGLTHRLALRATLPSRQHGRVRIQVREFATGMPVAANFLLEGTQQGSSYTEPDGTFVIEGVEPGWLKVTASADRFYPQTESVMVEPRLTHTLRIVVNRSGFGTLWGVVYAGDTRRPLAARVEYTGPEGGVVETSAKEGSFALRKLRAGAYDLKVTPADTAYLALSETLTVVPGQLTSRTLFCPSRLNSPASLPPLPDSLPAPSDRGGLLPLDDWDDE